MPYQTVEQAVPYPECFRESDDVAAQSQAAVLLLLSNLLHYEGERNREPLTVGAEPSLEEIMPEEDRLELNIPPEIMGLYEHRAERVDMRFAREWLAEVNPQRSWESLPQIAARLREAPTVVAVAGLCQAAMEHPDELVRVSAATAYLEICLPQQEDPAVAILELGTASKDPLVFEVATTALARFAPAHPILLDLMRPLPPEEAGEPSRTSLLVHGTWALQEKWWQPGGDFHTYMKNNVVKDLYSASDRFDWTGAWSHAARLEGGKNLRRWADDRGFASLDLFGHSHGANVSMVANKAGLKIGRLVLLSCPVHKDLYFPDFSLVGKVVSIRTRMDLAILADGGGQKFHHPKIKEVILPILFKHSVTHEPSTWTKYNLPSQI